MEKNWYRINFEYLDEESETFYMKLTESEKKLIEWLYRNHILYYFVLEQIDEPPFIEF